MPCSIREFTNEFCTPRGFFGYSPWSLRYRVDHESNEVPKMTPEESSDEMLILTMPLVLTAIREKSSQYRYKGVFYYRLNVLSDATQTTASSKISHLVFSFFLFLFSLSLAYT